MVQPIFMIENLSKLDEVHHIDRNGKAISIQTEVKRIVTRTIDCQNCRLKTDIRYCFL